METLLSNPALRLFGVTYLILVLKMVAVGYATSFYRIRDKHFATPEDYRLQGLTPKTGVNEDVERARRAHQNDLENIVPYFGAGLLYALSNPSLGMARLYFIGFTVARILHSVFYLLQLQPWRTIVWSIGHALLLFMVLSTILALV
jgi:glutathione S-transferase